MYYLWNIRYSLKNVFSDQNYIHITKSYQFMRGVNGTDKCHLLK